MTYRERQNGEGWFTADVNNNRNSQRGTHVENGGEVTLGASSSEIALNVNNTDIRVDGVGYTQSSGTVTLPENAAAYPRRDLIIARKGPTESDPASYDRLVGDPISEETLQTLIAEDIVDDGEARGQPIHPPENIPEVAPPEATGLRDEAAVLAMAYLPPGTADSTALSDDMITDLRREGIGVSDVLRTGQAIDEVENYNSTIEATVQNSKQHGGLTRHEELYQRVGYAVNSDGEIAPGNQVNITSLYIPDGRTAYLWAAAAHDSGGGSNTVRGRLYLGGDPIYNAKSFATGADGGGGTDGPWLREISGGQNMVFWLDNNSAEPKEIRSRWVITFE